MTNLSDNDRLTFVNGLELAELPSSLNVNLEKLLTLTASPRAGYIDLASPTSFVAGVSQQSQRDVLNSTLLAQLAANQKFNRETQTVEWYGFYRNVLENVGWVIESFAFSKYNASGSNFSMDKVVLDLIAAIATQDEVAVVQATIDALKALPQDDGRLVLFESSSHSASAGNFQICVVNESGGVVSMSIGASYFSTQQNVTNVLWFSFSSTSTNMYTGAQKISLNKQIYQNVRAAIVAKLGDKAKRFVHDLDIG